MLHGDDWLEGPLAPYRDNAIQTLNEYGVNNRNTLYKRRRSSNIVDNLLSKETTPEMRKMSLSGSCWPLR